MEKTAASRSQATGQPCKLATHHDSTQDHSTIADTLVAPEGPRSSIADRTNIRMAGYEFLHKLGEGGMGAVYLAKDLQLGRNVAIKVVSNSALRSTRAKQRFANEIQSVAALRHPNIAQLFSAGEENGVPYFVMEYVDGIPLDQRLMKRPLDTQEAAELVMKLAIAIQNCHEHGIIHRDLKPSNILIDDSGQPKIADFGLAKSFDSQIATTRTGEIVGSPAYMAPEQASGSEVSSATDVYGLGAILFHAITGQMPFSAPTAMKTIAKVISSDPIAPRKIDASIPKDLETICLKCLNKDADRRYESAASLAADLKRYLGSQPIMARPIGIGERVFKWSRRRPALAALVAVVCMGVPTVFAALIYHSATLDAALQKSKRLTDQASKFSNWLINQHQPQFDRLNGTLAIKSSLQGGVQDYLEKVIAENPENTTSLRRLANVYTRSAISLGGEHSSNLGNQAEALRLLKKALGLVDQVLDIDSADSVAINLKVQALLAISDLQFSRGEYESSLESMQHARRIIDLDENDHSADRRLVKLFLLQSRFNHLSANQENDRAMAVLEEFESAILEGPEEHLDASEAEHQLVWKLQNQSRMLIAKGDYDLANAAIQRALPIARKTYQQDSNDSVVVNRYINVLSIQSDLLTFKRMHQKALELLLEVAKLRHSHFEKNPKDMMAKFNLANALSSVSAAYMQVQDAGKQLQFARDSFGHFAELVSLSPKDRALKIALAQSHRDVGTALAASRRFTPAIASYQRAIDTVEQLGDANTQIESTGLIAELEMQLGMVYFQKLTANESVFSGRSTHIRELEDFRMAVTHFDRSLDVYRKAERLGKLNHQQLFLKRQASKAKSMIVELADQWLPSSEVSNP